MEYKALISTQIDELDDRVRRMWYSPNTDMGQIEADDLLLRIKSFERENYIVPATYGLLVFHYKGWLNEYIYKSDGDIKSKASSP